MDGQESGNPLGSSGFPHVRGAVETRFDQLFRQTDEGFEPRYRQGGAAEMLFTWEPLQAVRHAARGRGHGERLVAIGR